MLNLGVVGRAINEVMLEPLGDILVVILPCGLVIIPKATLLLSDDDGEL